MDKPPKDYAEYLTWQTEQKEIDDKKKEEK